MNNKNTSRWSRIHQIPIIGLFALILSLSIAPPLPTQAADGTEIIQYLNEADYSSNEKDESANLTAGGLYYAASKDRSGILVYIVNDKGRVVGRKTYFDAAGQPSYGDDYATFRVTHGTGDGFFSMIGYPAAKNEIEYMNGASTVYYGSSGWGARGSDVMSWLMSESDFELDTGVLQKTLPNWAYIVFKQSGADALLELLKTSEDETHWSVLVEPVSVGYLYTNKTFKEASTDKYEDYTYKAGDPIPSRVMYDDGSWIPEKYSGTAKYLAYYSDAVNGAGGGTFTWKFYNSQLAYSLCIAEQTTVMSPHGQITLNACSSSAHRITYSDISPSTGIGIAAIDITAMKPPIHTYWEPNGSPGYPEPKTEITSGECTINKVYITETKTYDSSGNLKSTKRTLDGSYPESSVTNYISIDDEPNNYSLFKWATGTTLPTVTINNSSNTDSGIILNKSNNGRSGTNATTIKLKSTSPTNEKFLTVVLVRYIEKQEEPPEQDRFIITQASLTERVYFSENSQTSELISHNFRWENTNWTPTCDGHGHSVSNGDGTSSWCGDYYCEGGSEFSVWTYTITDCVFFYAFFQ